MESEDLPVPAPRRKTRSVVLGSIQVGSDAPVSIQSMCSTDTRDVRATLDQIRALAAAGCDIVRVAVPDEEAADALHHICTDSPLPVVADIHLDHRLALKATTKGIAGLRYNPGNIGSDDHVMQLARAADDAGITVRIGVNAGSLNPRQKTASPQALVDLALKHAKILESAGLHRIKLSLKASDVRTTIAANRLCADRCDYPLHLGLTEAGPLVSGTVKSTLVLGILLAEGIGDTIRVSLSADPVEEIRVAKQLLRSLGLRRGGLELISCPRCGRASVEVYEMAERVERRLSHLRQPLHVAVMGCEVNGPGEARAVDVGIAGSRGGWILFARGERIERMKTDEAEQALVTTALRIAAERGRDGPAGGS